MEYINRVKGTKEIMIPKLAKILAKLHGSCSVPKPFFTLWFGASKGVFKRS